MTKPAAKPVVKKDLASPGKWFDAKAILDRILGGERVEDIARGFGVKRRTLNFMLLKHAPEDWREAQVMRAIERKEDAEDALDASQNLLDFNKANAKLKSAQWDLERICRRIYGEVREPTAPQVVVMMPSLRGGKTLPALPAINGGSDDAAD